MKFVKYTKPKAQQQLKLAGIVGVSMMLFVTGCSTSKRSQVIAKHQAIPEPDVGIPAIQVNRNGSGDPVEFGNVITRTNAMINQVSTADTNNVIICEIPDEGFFISNKGHKGD